MLLRPPSMLVCGDFIYTLEIIARILREVVNRERLCGTSVFCFGCFRKVSGCQPLGKYLHNLSLFRQSNTTHGYTQAHVHRYRQRLKDASARITTSKEAGTLLPSEGVEGRPQFRLTDSHTPLFHPVTLVLLSPCRDTRLGYHSTTQQ